MRRSASLNFVPIPPDNQHRRIRVAENSCLSNWERAEYDCHGRAHGFKTYAEGSNYRNWELSANRANAARRLGCRPTESALIK